jgi:hypothetical protein
LETSLVVGLSSVILVIAVSVSGVAGLSAYLWRIFIEQNAPGEAMEVRIAKLEMEIKALPSLWEEERKRAERSADSARKARASAQSKLDQLEEIIEGEEDEEIPFDDAAGSRNRELQPVLPGLGGNATEGIHERAEALKHLWI